MYFKKKENNMILVRKSEIQKIIMSKENGKCVGKTNKIGLSGPELRSRKKTPGWDGFTGEFYQK